MHLIFYCLHIANQAWGLGLKSSPLSFDKKFATKHFPHISHIEILTSTHPLPSPSSM